MGHLNGFSHRNRAQRHKRILYFWQKSFLKIFFGKLGKLFVHGFELVLIPADHIGGAGIPCHPVFALPEEQAFFGHLLQFLCQLNRLAPQSPGNGI